MEGIGWWKGGRRGQGERGRLGFLFFTFLRHILWLRVVFFSLDLHSYPLFLFFLSLKSVFLFVVFFGWLFLAGWEERLSFFWL